MVKAKRIRYIFIIYWFLLAYILAALIFWFMALNKQNRQMTAFRLERAGSGMEMLKIKKEERTKTIQYLGEGSIFLLLIATGAAFVFRAVRRQLKQGQQQQNFMMAITHELKTPIAVAKLNLETLQKRKLDGPQQERLIQNTLQEANRLNALCNNLLVSSQIEAGGYQASFEETNISELAKDCIGDFITRFPQRFIQSDIQAELFVLGDALLLQIMLNNLLDNAVKYSPKESTIQVSLQQQGNKARFSIADQGKGITDEEKRKIFDKFYRSGNEATKKAKGTGLGLYLTKRIVRQHKGNIFVTDNSPSGSIFVIELDIMAGNTGD